MNYVKGILMIFSWFTISIASQPIEVHELQKTGIIFENVDQALTYQQHWTIMTQVNIPQWNETINFINTCERVLNTLCDSLNNTTGDSNCKHWATEISQRTVRIREKIDEIKMYTQCSHPRERRGLINVGGTITKFLFGTMDHEDSEQIHKLEELENSNKRSINLAKQQMTLLKTNNEILGQSLLNLTTQQNILTTKTNRFFTTTMEKLKNATSEIKYVHVMAEINEIALFMLNELQKITEQITTFFVLEAVQRNELHPLMVPARELREIYRQITSTQDRNWNFDFNLAKLITKTYSQCAKDKILIKILIPIFEHLIFKQGSKLFIHEYICHKNFELDELNFQSHCTSTNTTFFLCKRTGPIRITPGEGNCIQKLFRNPFFEPPNCEHRILKHVNNFIVPMKHGNSWLYWLQTTIPLYSQCPNELITSRLQGAGILRLIQPCTFRLGEFIIPFKNDALHNISFYQPTKIELPDLTHYRPYLNTPTKNLDYQNLTVLDTSSLHASLIENSKTFKHLDAEIAMLENQKSTNTLHIKFNALSITLVSIIILVCIYLVRKYCFPTKHELNPSTETRRRRIEFISNPIEIPRREQLVVSMPELSSPATLETV